mmetsp:Transcript_103870/g.299067  ORF Transcript_103870/g.299067 Transcript_103870/m.299067 type:complete len:153 (-) Transcript_103870:124-582(-)
MGRSTNHSATVVEVDLARVKGQVVNLAVDNAAAANGLTGELAQQAWTSSTVLIGGVPGESLTGRFFEVSWREPAGQGVLGVAGLDRMTELTGQVSNFGSYRLWREEFDAVYSEAAERKLHYALEKRPRRSMLEAAAGAAHGRGQRAKKPVNK